MRDCRTRGETPLHRAAVFGIPETIEMLLAAGADRERKDARGETPHARQPVGDTRQQRVTFN